MVDILFLIKVLCFELLFLIVKIQLAEVSTVIISGRLDFPKVVSTVVLLKVFSLVYSNTDLCVLIIVIISAQVAISFS